MTTPESKEISTQEPTQPIVPEHEPPKEIATVQEQVSTVTPGQAAAQAAADATQQASPVAAPQVVTVTVPATPQQLDDWSKGSPDNSLTWLGFYWLRMIKKALFHGYRVITESPAQTQYA